MLLRIPKNQMKKQMNNWISNKIRLLANRVRCSRCYADSSMAVFLIRENIKFKIPINIKEDYKPIFSKSRKMTIRKFYDLESADGLTRICTRCGKSRKTGIPLLW
jgi:ribosomal protein S27AE